MRENQPIPHVILGPNWVAVAKHSNDSSPFRHVTLFDGGAQHVQSTNVHVATIDTTSPKISGYVHPGGNWELDDTEFFVKGVTTRLTEGALTPAQQALLKEAAIQGRRDIGLIIGSIFDRYEETQRSGEEVPEFLQESYEAAQAAEKRYGIKGYELMRRPKSEDQEFPDA